jgi:hypothetical protein
MAQRRLCDLGRVVSNRSPISRCVVSIGYYWSKEVAKMSFDRLERLGPVCRTSHVSRCLIPYATLTSSPITM